MEKDFNTNDYLLEMVTNKKRKNNQIIALFAIVKKVKFENENQVSSFIKRHGKAASLLKDYGLERIRDCMLYVDETVDFKWTIETIGKYIDEDFNKLTGKEPIIILKNGTSIYDVATIRKLEKDGRVCYKEGKWIELQG